MTKKYRFVIQRKWKMALNHYFLKGKLKIRKLISVARTLFLCFWRLKYNTWNFLEARNLLFLPLCPLCSPHLTADTAAGEEGKTVPVTFTSGVLVMFKNKRMESWRKLSPEHFKSQNTSELSSATVFTRVYRTS